MENSQILDHISHATKLAGDSISSKRMTNVVISSYFDSLWTSVNGVCLLLTYHRYVNNGSIESLTPKLKAASCLEMQDTQELPSQITGGDMGGDMIILKNSLINYDETSFF